MMAPPAPPLVRLRMHGRTPELAARVRQLLAAKGREVVKAAYGRGGG
jgi:hypothetical protein